MENQNVSGARRVLQLLAGICVLILTASAGMVGIFAIAMSAGGGIVLFVTTFIVVGSITFLLGKLSHKLLVNKKDVSIKSTPIANTSMPKSVATFALALVLTIFSLAIAGLVMTDDRFRGIGTFRLPGLFIGFYIYYLALTSHNSILKTLLWIILIFPVIFILLPIAGIYFLRFVMGVLLA